MDGLYIRTFEVGDQDQATSLILEGFGERFGYIDETLNQIFYSIIRTVIHLYESEERALLAYRASTSLLPVPRV